MNEHNWPAAVSRCCRAGWAALLLLLSAATAGAQTTYNQGYNTGSMYGSSSSGSSYGSSRYSSSSSRYRSSSSYGSSSTSGYGSSSTSGYGSSSSRYSSSGSSRYSSSKTNDSTKSGTTTKSKTTTSQTDRAKSGQAKTNVTTRKTAPGAAKGKSKGATKTAAGGGKGESSLPADFKANALYFTPGERALQTGDLFDTTLTYFNRAHEPIERVSLWVHYDPKAVEPTWVDTQKLDALTTSTIEARVWRETGYVHIAAQLGHPLADAATPLVQINWKALAPDVESYIDLAAPRDEEKTGVYAAGRNLLVNNFFNDPGAVRMRVQIQAHMTDDYKEKDVETLRQTLAAADLKPLERVRLAIVPNNELTAAGQVGTADVVLLNPAGLDLDHIRLRIRYQPELVEVLDADQDNYITQGINIFDGDFHERFPFDSLIANRVRPAGGVIDYEVGSLTGARSYRGGTIARIVYRALKPTERAVFWFDVNDPRTSLRATDVSSEGVSLLGRTDEIAAAALHGAEVKIQ